MCWPRKAAGNPDEVEAGVKGDVETGRSIAFQLADEHGGYPMPSHRHSPGTNPEPTDIIL